MNIRFAPADLELFAAASHDRNPLHLSPSYARRSPFGQQVVYGALGALACWPALAPPPGRRIAALHIEFSRPMFLNVDYQVAVDENSVRIMDGSTQLLHARAEYCDGTAAPLPSTEPVPPPRADAGTPQESLLVPGFTRSGEYQAQPAPTCALLARFGIEQPTLPVIALLWSSYVAGMELPGERALFFKLALRFAEYQPCTDVLQWEAVLFKRNALNQLRSGVKLSLAGQAAAAGHIEAYLRPQPVAPPRIKTRSRALAGTTALVTGASRGLGAAISRALAAQGGAVLANFQHSLPEAEQLAQSVEGLPGSIALRQGDAADVAWSRSLRAECPRLDFLILNACPPVLRLWVEPETAARLNDYVATAFSMVSAPLAAFAGAVEKWAVLISSIYVETLPKDFPQYVALKAAAEGLFRIAARQYPKTGFLIVRPPKLLTDMTNTPFGTGDAIFPETVASRIVARLRTPSRNPGEVEMMNLKRLGVAKKKK